MARTVKEPAAQAQEPAKRKRAPRGAAAAASDVEAKPASDKGAKGKTAVKDGEKKKEKAPLKAKAAPKEKEPKEPKAPKEKETKKKKKDVPGKDEFLATRVAVPVNVNGVDMTAEPKTMSTGSLGWHVTKHATIGEDSVVITVNITVKGSKEGDKGGEKADRESDTEVDSDEPKTKPKKAAAKKDAEPKKAKEPKAKAAPKRKKAAAKEDPVETDGDDSGDKAEANGITNESSDADDKKTKKTTKKRRITAD